MVPQNLFPIVLLINIHAGERQYIIGSVTPQLSEMEKGLEFYKGHSPPVRCLSSTLLS